MSDYKGPRYWFRYLEITNELKKHDLQGKSVLDIGAGSLHLSSYLASKGASVTAVDLSEDLKLLHKKVPKKIRENITCIENNFLSHDFRNKKFDIIIAMEVLEHVKEENDFLEKVKKLLISKGIIIISVPAHMSMWSKHDYAVGHLRRYERRDFKKIVKFLKIRRFELISYGWPWINILRYLRIVTTRLIYGRAEKFDQTEKSVFSGKSIDRFGLLKFFSNKYVIFPFWIISRIFVNTDWSDGYVFIVYSL